MVALRPSLLVILAALAAFCGSLGASFAFDDHSLFSDPVLAAPGGWHDVFGPLQTRPLTWLTFWMNRQFSGSPLAWHFVNLLLHVAAALLVFDVLSRLLPERAALIAAVLFAVHPIQTEAVTYVFARAIVLAAVFCLLSLRAWLQEGRWIAVLWFAAALLAKEEAAGLPVFLALLHLSGKRSADERAPMAVMVLLSLAAGVRVIIAASLIPGAGAGAASGITWWQYLSSQGLVILRYARLLLVPFGFTVDPDIHIDTGWTAWLAWLLIATVAVLALRRFAGLREGFWLIAGLALLAPSSSVFPASDLATDRRLYLPMIAFCAGAGLMLSKVRPAALIALCAVLAVLSGARTQVWRTEESLWTDAEARAPGKLRPKLQLARVTGSPARAEALLLAAKRLAPDDPHVAAEMGRHYLASNRPDAALGEFGRALALTPSSALNRNNRGVALAALGQTEAARQDFEGALQLDPCLFDARLNLKRMDMPTSPPAHCRFTPEQRDLLR